MDGWMERGRDGNDVCERGGDYCRQCITHEQSEKKQKCCTMPADLLCALASIDDLSSVLLIFMLAWSFIAFVYEYIVYIKYSKASAADADDDTEWAVVVVVVGAAAAAAAAAAAVFTAAGWVTLVTGHHSF
uniref:MARVEL domain-containing protein n=1 Tax=Syphacia muris TaxID=451379 RepID=A0A0N5AYI0_9BILA